MHRPRPFSKAHLITPALLASSVASSIPNRGSIPATLDQRAPVSTSANAPIPAASSADPLAGPLSDVTSWDRWLNDFLLKCDDLSLTLAIEQGLQQFFASEQAVFWQNIPSIGQLYSETFGIATVYSTGLPGVCVKSKGPVQIEDPQLHDSYEQVVDGRFARPGLQLYFFPLADEIGGTVGVAEIVRKAPIGESEGRFAVWFMRKFQGLYQWLNVSRDIEALATDLQMCEKEEVFRERIFPKLKEDFSARVIEIWKYDEASRRVGRYREDGYQALRKEDGGIGWGAIDRMEIINIPMSRLSGSYGAIADGDQDESVLAVPVRTAAVVWCVVLRRPARVLFSVSDENRLKKLAPIIAGGFANCEKLSGGGEDLGKLRLELQSMQALVAALEVISAERDPVKLVNTVMELGRGVIRADRCSIWLLNEAKDRLTTCFQSGLSGPIELALDTGIAGYSVSEGVVVNTPDAYESPYFDSTVDRDNGYRSRSIVAVPIYNAQREVIGCTVFINKSDDEGFSDWDVKVIALFNVLCGIGLENARLFQESQDISVCISTMRDTASSLAKSEEIDKILAEVLQNAKALVCAERVSLFTLESSATEFATLLADGANVPATLPFGKGLVSVAAKTKNPVIENDCYMNSDFNPSIDRACAYRTRSLMALPIIARSGSVLGVVEFLNKTKGAFTSSDVMTVSPFAAFASVALQKPGQQSAAPISGIEAELAKYMTPNERTGYAIPAALKLTQEEQETVLSMNCFSPDFKGIGHFKECFFFVTLFNFLEEFKITAQRFYTFLSEISSRYTGTSYHNWTHACDVTQCIVFMLHKGRLGDAYQGWELFVLIIASICHDTNHRGFNNVYNVKAETPLGILFKEQSVMEMHHITQAIPVISQDNIGLFESFDETQLKQVWTLFIRIILSTDMARHFDLVKKAQAAVDEGNFDMENEDYRLLGLQLIMKVGDISNVSRPFEIADKWCDILNQEFFHQGDLEKSSGIGLTSPLNDRNAANKPKSQIGFYTFICLPLYTVVAKLYPPLQVQVDQVRQNLDQWKALAAKQ
jgi:3',5'-cyclic-nucleotide phosphodiesterase